MRTLVTGGLGFLGSHLVEILLERGDEVTIVDNLSSNVVEAKFFESKAKVFPVSVWELADWLPEDYDETYHLASVVGPAGVLPHAGQIVKSVVNDTYVMAAFAKRCEAKLLDVSTSEVYGGGNKGYCSEEMDKIITKTSARLEYAVGKLAAETALINMKSNCVIVRPFNIAGPRQSKKGGFVLPRFLEQAKKGEPLTVFGDGKAVRAFTHVKDVARGLILAMDKGKAGEAYNIGNPHNKMTILELAELVIKVTDSKSRVEFVDPKEIWGQYFEEAADKYPDATKATIELGWKPEYNIEEIIEETWQSLS